jgi:diacylglycerol kinase family enzyme
MTVRRVAAVAFLVLAPVTLALAVGTVLTTQGGLVVVACLFAAVGAAWYGLRRRGWRRVSGLTVASLALVGGLVVELVVERLLRDALVLLFGMLTLAAARVAFRVHVPLPDAVPPRRPVLFWNPRSGGGKAERYALPSEAWARGIEPVELRPGDDLEVLARAAVSRGADGLAMAGGDGSQAIVAAVAAEHHLPYACIPAGTRNHFALDLGVERDDVVGALDAFVDGGEHVVDLAEVNGQVFVNNVSLGLYAEAVQREGYREAKVKTLLDVLPDVLGPDVLTRDEIGASGEGAGLRWTGRGGQQNQAGVAILVSNNRYRLGRVVGAGTRPRIDDGLLGIVVASAPRRHSPGEGRPRVPLREWSAPEFEVDADHPVVAGIDGEAAVLSPPVRFRILPGVLRARIAKSHPGASPSAVEPEGLLPSLQVLVRIAVGREEEREGGRSSRRGSTGCGPW